jgi:hypothetical protein
MDDNFPTRLLRPALFGVGKVIVGQDRPVERLLTALLPAGAACPKACDAGSRAG